MSNIPKMDKRDFDELLEQVENLAKQYTPEWNFDKKSSDMGTVFAKIFCTMLESTISRYNKTAYNHYLTFLNMLGTKLRPAAPASGMIVAGVAPETDGAYIEKGTALYAQADTEEGMVIYETLDSLSAVDTTVNSVYFTEPSSDFIGFIYDGSENPNSDKIGPFRVFDNVFYKNLQCHEIYFGDEVVFDMSDTNVTFYFYNNLSAKGEKQLPQIFFDPENVCWEYYDGVRWVKIRDVQKTEFGVNIRFKGKSEITEVMGKTSRFIRCSFKRIPEEGVALTCVKYQSLSSTLSISEYFCDGSQLPVNDFMPFGEQYALYTTFDFACQEAFTKKGALIEVSTEIQFKKIKLDTQAPDRKYKLIMSEMDFADLQPEDIQIEKVRWEYWNGSGWARLFPDDSYEDFFALGSDNITKKTLKFKCPQDIEKMSVGSLESYFIRARISKMRNQFDFYANYITPFIHSIDVKYNYEGDGHSFKEMSVKSDLKEYNVNFTDAGVVKLLEKKLCDYPAMYLCLSRPLVQGMIRLFINIEEGIHRFNPAVKWEYLADDHKGGSTWSHIDVMDATEGFSHSETITMIGKNDFKEATLFGQTGYFIRIINPDKKYSDSSDIAGRPIINDIKFNAVRVIQKDTREPEYFAIEQDEENKLCTLSYPNASSVEVWVDELGAISTKEQEQFLKMSRSEVETEYDELGKLERLWIKWDAVPNLVACGMNDRVYEVDYPRGEVLFGNGKNGKIPPEQYNESIKIVYSVCNGTRGNIESHSVNDFVDTIVNIQNIDNPSPIMGGVDMETIDGAARRMFGQIAGGNRLVSLSDFEDSICFNDRNIYKVKCISHVDEDSRQCLGITSVAVLPREFMQGYEKFQGIKEKVWKFIDKKAPAPIATSSRLRIFEVAYVETCVSVDVVIKDFNSYQKVYKGIESRLKKFFNPVSGNFSGKGWDIGEFPRKESVYNYIKTVPDIEWIKKINIFTNLITAKGKKEIDFEKIKEHRFVVPVYGTPEINISAN